MKYFLTPIFTLFTVIGLISCSKDGQPEPVGGDLPTNYIIMSDSAFTPNNITAVNGSTFTFVNRSSVARGIYSLDSVVINKQSIAVNTSFIFKKDTTATIIYRMAGRPSVSGSITITP